MDRIAAAFRLAQQENRAAFVAYLCAGDPDFDHSLDACRALLRNGVDLLELGVPFSDPLADGLTNQLAAQRALESGMTASRVFELVAVLRAEFPDTPMVFYTYYNLVFSNGVEDYVKQAKAAGLDGLLTLDLPPEEAGELSAACAKHDLKMVFIVAPTTPGSRLATITAVATGFVYYVSREGVTGERESLAVNIPDAVKAIKAHTALPVVVGFGISKRSHVAEVAQHADGVVVGSALVNVIRDGLKDRSKIGAAMETKIKDLVVGVRR
jgi:tryptophan synthase alpha chain